MTDIPTYYDTIVASPEWQEWQSVAHRHGFDWHESVETGWLSPDHFAAFINWIRNKEQKETTESVTPWLRNENGNFNVPSIDATHLAGRVGKTLAYIHPKNGRIYTWQLISINDDHAENSLED